MHTKVETNVSPKEHTSIIQLTHEVIQHAYDNNASDIHIDPLAHTVRVRFRIDGIMVERQSLAKTISSEIISRIKILSNLRTDEHHVPQDGRFKAILKNETAIDIRVSIIPSFYGESIVLRLLPKERKRNTLADLGFKEEDEVRIRRELAKTSGMILVTGPTGSGKTTTLYTLLQHLRQDIAIVTIEDPIEYAIDNVRQIQVNTRTGLSFANGLRSILRQDPDVIMIGEIRDKETVSISVHSALTGHLILSTLHTNDAASAIPRLIDMGVEPYLISSVINLIIAQRLVRTICNHCKITKMIDETAPLVRTILEGHTHFYSGKGCEACHYTGYKGRVSMYEIIVVDDDLRALILKKPSHQELKNMLSLKGNKSLVHDGIRKAIQGITSLEEVLRVIHE